MKNPFTQHPRAIGLGYVQHAVGALQMALSLIVTAVLIAIHSVFPFLFVNAGDRILQAAEKLNHTRSGAEK